MTRGVAALLLDLGDTIMDEGTEVKDSDDTGRRADLVPGMAEALRGFAAKGLPLAIVADSRPQTPPNILGQHGLLDLFGCLAISDVVGAAKPSPVIFRAALDALGVAESDYSRVVMVGNNLERDIVGANRLGMVSVLLHWNDRRRSTPLSPEERPRYVVASAGDLVALIERLDSRG